ncbi:MAG: SEL1-like repeat protein [Planctomycetes bacterium]|nr:SEL1-like repeat protein [Planctomycetota bacterium]
MDPPPAVRRLLSQRETTSERVGILFALSRFANSSPDEKDQILRFLSASRKPEALFARGAIALQDKTPTDIEPDAQRLLEQAFEGGLPLAGTILGRALSRGRLGGNRKEARRWLERAALRGQAEAAMTLWELDPSDERWLRMAAALGHAPAAGAWGESLLESKPNRARAWLERAVETRGDPRAYGLLAGLVSKSEPLRAQGLARRGAQTADPNLLEVYADLLLLPNVGRFDPWAALEIFGGLAFLEHGGRAALRAASIATRIASQGPFPQEAIRSLLRRALLDPETHDLARAELEQLTQGVPDTAPVRSRSQLTLLAQAKAGVREAIVEVGRRAMIEARGQPRFDAIEAAAATGDLQSRFRLARTLHASGHPNSDRERAQREYEAIGSAGLSQAWIRLRIYAPTLRGGRAALLKRLREQAAKGNANAMYAIGLVLSKDDAGFDRGVVWIRRAAAAGEREASEFLEQVELTGPRAAEVVRRLLAAPRPNHALLARAYGRGNGVTPNPILARRHLLLTVLSEGVASDAAAFGEMLCQLPAPNPSVGVLWLKHADERGLPLARLDLAKLYLKHPEFNRFPEAIAKLEQLARDEEIPHARLLLGRIYLMGRGVPVDLGRAEAELSRVADQLPAAAAALGQMYVSQGQGAKGRGLLRSATAAGNANARAALAKALLYGQGGGPPELEEGLRLLREGERLGERESCRVLARLYELGRFVPKNLELADRLLRKANRPRRR